VERFSASGRGCENLLTRSLIRWDFDGYQEVLCDLMISVLRNYAHGIPKDNPDTPHILIWNEGVLVPICAQIWKFIYSQDKNGGMRIRMKGCSVQIPHLLIKLSSSEENTYAKLFLLRKGRCRLELSSRHCFIILVPSLMLAMKGTGGK